MKQVHNAFPAVSTSSLAVAASQFSTIQHHIQLGKSHHHGARLSQACFHYEQAIHLSSKLLNSASLGSERLDSELSEAHHLLATIWQERGEWEKAEVHYQTALFLRPSQADSHFNLGLLSARQGRYGLAISCYQRVISLQPNHLPAHLNLGAILVQQKAYDEAIAFYQAALVRFPASARLRNNLGQTLFQQGTVAGALQQYRAALTLDPSFAKAHSNMAQLWWQHQDLAKAHSHYAAGVALHSSLPALGNLALVAMGQGDFDAFVEALNRAVAAMPEVVEAYCQTAEADPSTQGLAKARNLASKLLRTLQNRTLSTPQETYGQAAQWLFEIYAESGAIAQESEAYHRAEILYQRALALRPHSVALYGKLAHCLVQQRRRSAATAILQIGKSLAGPALAKKLEQIDLSPSPKPQRQAPTSCSVTCSRCMEELIGGFRPQQTAAGVFQIQPKAGPKFPWPKPQVRQLQNGRVWAAPYQSDWAACHEIVVTTSAAQRVAQGSRQYPWKLPNCSAQHSAVDVPFDPSCLPPVEILSGTAVVLSTLSGHVFYHWMIDLLPRLALLQQEGVQFDQIDHFIVNSLDHGFQRETLEVLGVPLERVIESDRHPHLQAEQLIVPSFPGHLDWVPPSTIDFLRSKFLSRDSPTPKSKLPKRIYISRQNARYRRVLNDSKLQNILQPHGFITIALEELTVTEQAQLFAHAEIIVAPHGSGLTNLVFCQSGTQVIELFAPRYIRTDYWMVSQYLKLRHSYIVGKSVDCAPLQELMYQSPLIEDIYVEPNSLRSALRLVGLSTAQS